jgi:hypothetical protein
MDRINELVFVITNENGQVLSVHLDLIAAFNEFINLPGDKTLASQNGWDGTLITSLQI